MDSFYVVLPSNTPFEGNRSSCFTVRLPEVLELDTSWTVALSSIIYPLSFREEDSQEPQYMDLMQLVDDKYHTRHRVPVPNLRHDTVPSLAYAINKCLWESYGNFEGVRKKHIDETKYPKIEEGFKYLKEVERFQFIAPPPFAHIRLTKQLSYMLGFAEEVVESGEIAKYNPDLIADARQFFCYAPKLIEHTIVGNVTAPLLRVINVQGEYGTVKEDIYTSEHHHKIAYKRISEITIELRNSSGKLIHFSWGTVIVTLHFQRKLF